MADDVYSIELRLELLQMLDQLESAGRSTKTLETILDSLVQELQTVQSGARTAGGVIEKALGSDLEKSSDRARIALEVIKTGFRELVQSGRSLDEVALAFNKIADPKLQKGFGTEFAKDIRNSVSLAVKELREEFKQLDQQVRQSDQVTKAYAETARRGFGDPLISAQQFRAQVEQVKQQMIDLQRISKLSLDDVVKGFQQANSESGKFSSGVIQQAARELENFGNKAQQVGQQMGALDQISTVFFGTTLGNLAINALRRLVSQFDEIIDRGVEFSRTQFILATAIRGVQRLGVDITFAEVNKQIENLSNTFSFFSERQIRQGVGQILLLTRNLKLTKEEIFRLTEATAALAIVTGKDFGEEGMLVARAIASGYTEALQRAGIDASRTKIQTVALSMGIDKAFLAMTQAERAAVTLAIVLKQVGNISEDVAVFQDTLAGSVGESNARLEEQADILGKKLTPAYVLWRKTLANIGEGFLGWLGIAQVGFFSLFSTMVGGFIGLGAAFTALKDGVVLSMEEINAAGLEAANQLFETWVNEFIVPTQNLFKDTEIGVPEVEFDETANELKEAADKLKDDVKDIIRDYQTGLEDATIDFLREGIDIELEFDRDSFDEQLEFQQDLAKLALDTTNKISDKQDEFREKELKAERDFQEKLLKLRESFLFDLEDALRERDAKQVLRLIRQFNLRETQLQREFANENEERALAFEDEIADIKLQQQRKADELQLEFAERQAELELQRAREYEDRQTAYNREVEDLLRRKAERLSILKEGLEAELQMLVDYWAGVLTISQIGAVRLSEILHSIFGGNIGTGQSGGPGFSGGGGFGAGGGQEFAEGGTLIARKPTVAVFGEKGAEMVSFKPVSRIGRDENKVFNGFLPGSANGSGSMLIELLLSPDLEARIVDNTLGQVGDVLIKTLR